MVRALAVMVMLANSADARAASQGDWFASLYTGDGVELRQDERVFTLFALLNATGFDAGPVVRQHPVPKTAYHAVRQQVRSRVLGGDAEVRKAADAFFDAHPATLAKYLAAVLKSKDVNDLKGFEQVMAKANTGWKLDELSGQVQPEYRRALKAYLSVVDEPLTRARRLLATPESVEVTVVMNLLDAQGEVRMVAEGEQIYVVVGPSDAPNVSGVVREFARSSLEAIVAKQVAKWSGSAATFREAQLAGAVEPTPAEWATSMLTQAVALRATQATDAAYDALAARGCGGIKEAAKALEEGKTLDAWVSEALSKCDTRRSAKK